MLKNLTENQIKQFAGSTIYARGYDYYKAGRVAELIYQPDLEKIQAMVSGSYGSYGVTVQLIKNTIKASCECPYEGYPCKHVVAILLTFSKDHKHYEQKAQKPQSALEDYRTGHEQSSQKRSGEYDLSLRPGLS